MQVQNFAPLPYSPLTGSGRPSTSKIPNNCSSRSTGRTPFQEIGEPFCGLAFKLQQDKYGQLTYFRVYQGTVSAGDTIYNVSNEMRKVRVPRMFRMHSEDREEIPSAEAGDIVAFYGVEASSGETFTDGKVQWTLTSMHVPAAVISLAVAPKDRATEVN